MLRFVLLLVVALAATISAVTQQPPSTVNYVSSFHSRDPNVDERYRDMILQTEAKHRAQYEQEVARRVGDESVKQAVIEKSIAEARSVTADLQQQQSTLTTQTNSLLKDSEVSISRQKLTALRDHFDKISDRLRHNLVMEEAVDHKYRDERRILARTERMEAERRKKAAQEFQQRLEKELAEDKDREAKEKAEREKEAERKKQMEAAEKEHKEKLAAEEAAAAAKRAEDDKKKQQDEADAEAARKANEKTAAQAQNNQVLSETQSETASLENEEKAEEDESNRLLESEKEFEQKEAQKLQEERIADAEAAASQKAQEDKVVVASMEAAATAKQAELASDKSAGGATLLELTGGARGRCQISVSSTGSSSSGDEPTVDGLNSKGECQIGPKVQPTIEELYPILPELHKRPQEEFHENDYMDTRKVQLPEMDGKLSVDLQVFSSSEKLLQHAHNEHLTFTEQNKKTCGKPICEPKVDHFAGYP